MRVNVYADEITDRVEIISKHIDVHDFIGLRFYGDDDSAAITFWGKRDMRELLRKALMLLDDYYRSR